MTAALIAKLSAGLMPLATARSIAAFAGARNKAPPSPSVAVSTAPMMAPFVPAWPRTVSPLFAKKSRTAALSCGLIPAAIRARSTCSPDSTSVLPAVAPAHAPPTVPIGPAIDPAAPPANMPPIGATMLGICSTMPPPIADRFFPVSRMPAMTPGASRQSLEISPATFEMPPEIPSPDSQAFISSLPSLVPGFALR